MNGPAHTDPRLLGVTSAMSDEALGNEEHSRIKACVQADFRDFLRAPTMPNLRACVEWMLAFQDSHLAGARRVPAWKAARKAAEGSE